MTFVVCHLAYFLSKAYYRFYLNSQPTIHYFHRRLLPFGCACSIIDFEGPLPVDRLAHRPQNEFHCLHRHHPHAHRPPFHVVVAWTGALVVVSWVAWNIRDFLWPMTMTMMIGILRNGHLYSLGRRGELLHLLLSCACPPHIDCPCDFGDAAVDGGCTAEHSHVDDDPCPPSVAAARHDHLHDLNWRRCAPASGHHDPGHLLDGDGGWAGGDGSDSAVDVGRIFYAFVLGRHRHVQVAVVLCPNCRPCRAQPRPLPARLRADPVPRPAWPGM